MGIDPNSGFTPGVTLQSDGTVDISANVVNHGAPGDATFSVIGPNGRPVQFITANRASMMNCGVDAGGNAQFAQIQGTTASCGYLATGQVVNMYLAGVSLGRGQYRIVVESAGSPKTSVKGASFKAQTLG